MSRAVLLHLRSARAANAAFIAGAAGLWLALCLPVAKAQDFDPEREALDPRSRIEFNLSSLAADSSTEVGGVSADRTSSRHEGAGLYGGLAAGPFFLGGGGQRVLFREKTPQFQVRLEREAIGGALSLRAGSFAAVLSAGNSVFDSEVDDSGSGTGTAYRIEFRIELATDAALGLFLDLGPLRLGYSRAKERLKLDFDEAAQSFRERYDFESNAYHAALSFGDAKGFQISAGIKRAASPSTSGEDIDYDGSDESTDFGSLGYAFDADNRSYLSLSRSASEVRFTDLLEIETLERTVGVGITLKSGLSLSLSQSEQLNTQAFAPAMGLRKVESATTSVNARLGWRF